MNDRIWIRPKEKPDMDLLLMKKLIGQKIFDRFNKIGSATVHFKIQIVIWIRWEPISLKPGLKTVEFFFDQ